MEWVKCSERMPDDDTLCLGYDEFGVIWTMHYDGDDFSPDTGGGVCVSFSHWMPLPEPPKD